MEMSGRQGLIQMETSGRQDQMELETLGQQDQMMETLLCNNIEEFPKCMQQIFFCHTSHLSSTRRTMLMQQHVSS
eukprot:3510870-Ditylum_brightwellii.AAC.1